MMGGGVPWRRCLRRAGVVSGCSVWGLLPGVVAALTFSSCWKELGDVRVMVVVVRVYLLRQ